MGFLGSIGKLAGGLIGIGTGGLSNLLPAIGGAALGALAGTKKTPGSVSVMKFPGSAGGGSAGMVCPPGTACQGPFSAGGVCLGKCAPYSMGGMQPQGGALTPYGVQGYCAMAVGPGQIKLAPSPCRGYHWNESRYAYGLGSGQCQVVERGTKLVRNRRINPANAQAARRAVRRLNGTYSLLRSIEKSMAKLGGRSARHARKAIARGHCSGGCAPGKCSCR